MTPLTPTTQAPSSSTGSLFTYYMLKKHEPRHWPPATAEDIENIFVDILPWLRFNTKSAKQFMARHENDMSLVLLNSEVDAAAAGRMFTQGLLGPHQSLLCIKGAALLGSPIHYDVIPESESFLSYSVVSGTVNELCKFFEETQATSMAVTLQFVASEGDGSEVQEQDIPQLCEQAQESQCLGRINMIGKVMLQMSFWEEFIATMTAQEAPQDRMCSRTA